MVAALSDAGLALVATGGALYTLGVAFHLWDRLPFQNAIWHAHVLAASFVFYAAVVVEVGAKAP
jgi:hemolysin III